MYKIYALIDNTNDDTYIGRTIQTFKERLNQHKEPRSKCVSKKIIENGDYRMELIEETDDINRERYWILNTECINKIIPGIVDSDKKEIFKIYKIIDNTNGNIYIGLTIRTLKERLNHHKHQLDCVSRDIIKNGDYKIELIEETTDKSRERYWIENTECINKVIPGRTGKEYRQDTKEQWAPYYQNYRDTHKEENLIYQRQYRIDNKEELSAQRKEYRNNNKEKIALQKKKQYEKNKEKIAERRRIEYEKNRDRFLAEKKEYYEKHKEKILAREKIRYDYLKSWGGDKRYNNNLLEIDINLFNPQSL